MSSDLSILYVFSHICTVTVISFILADILIVLLINKKNVLNYMCHLIYVTHIFITFDEHYNLKKNKYVRLKIHYKMDLFFFNDALYE